MSKNILLIGVDAVKQRSAVHANVDDKLILPEIKVAQDIEILPAIGSRLFRRLQEGIEANNLNSDERLLLDEFIADTLIWFVISALPITSSYQFYTKGAIRKSSENTEVPGFDELLRLSETYKNRAEYYRERLIRYLYANKRLYPDFLGDCSTNTGDELPPDKSGYSTSCYLWDD